MIIKLTKQHKSIHTIIIPWSKIYKLLETERNIPKNFYVYHCDSNISGLASLLLWCDTIKMICYYSPPGEIVYSMWQMINDGRVGPTGIRYNHKNNVQSKLLIVFTKFVKELTPYSYSPLKQNFFRWNNFNQFSFLEILMNKNY